VRLSTSITVNNESTAGDELTGLLNDNKTKIFFGFIFVLIVCLFLYFLFYKFHWGFALASIIMMSTRVPDLLWEIKKNQKITKKYGPIHSSFSSTLGLFLELGVAVLVCYSVYKS
jgi:hypothetical protein